MNCKEVITSLQLYRRPFLPRYPRRVYTVVRLVNRNIHYMAPSHNFEAAIRHVAVINGKEDSQVFDILDMRVSCAVKMRREATCERELVVD